MSAVHGWKREVGAKALTLPQDSAHSFILAFPQRLATEWRRVLNIRELFKSQLPAPPKQSMASADSTEKMNLGPMDFPVSQGSVGGGRL